MRHGGQLLAGVGPRLPERVPGLLSEPVVITLAVAGVSEVRFPRWFMLAAQVGCSVGLALAYRLLHQAIFEIGAVCPWCLLITVATTWVFVEPTRVNLLEGHLRVPGRWHGVAVDALRARLDVVAATAWLLGVALPLVSRYGTAPFA